MSFIREETEHAYNSTRRLRLRLSALARLIEGHSQQQGRAARTASEATGVLEACACTFHRLDNEKELKILALHISEDINEASLERSASRLAANVVNAHESVALKKLALRQASDSWLGSVGIQSYLGIPFFVNGKLMGVVGLFGSGNREFNEEDEWWLRSAAQAVADELACEQLEAKVHELEKALMRAPTNFSGENSDQQDTQSTLSVLVVDDDRNINDILCEALSLDGYHVEAAFDGLEAMQKFRPAEHDVVMTDVAMPLMNGWELIAALRVRAPELPVVLITGYGSGNWNENYLRTQGVCAVLSKPLDLTQLSEVLEGIRAKKNAFVLS